MAEEMRTLITCIIPQPSSEICIQRDKDDHLGDWVISIDRTARSTGFGADIRIYLAWATSACESIGKQALNVSRLPATIDVIREILESQTC